MRVAVELHEYQVPDLHVAVAVLLRAAGRAAGHVGAVIVKDLAARSTGSRISHRPEIVFLSATAEPVFIDSDLFQPDGLGIGIIMEDGDPEFLLRDGQLPGKELPGIMDSLFLEIVSETEITQHLEKSMVAGGVSDVFQVVVFAPGAYAALGGHGARAGALLKAEEYFLELHHAGVGEQQRRIIGRHQG